MVLSFICPFASGVVIMKNHESFMNLVEQVSLSDGDQTWKDVSDQEEEQSLTRSMGRKIAGKEELKEDATCISEEAVPKIRSQHIGITLGCISVFISMVTTRIDHAYKKTSTYEIRHNAFSFSFMHSLLFYRSELPLLSHSCSRKEILWVVMHFVMDL